MVLRARGGKVSNQRVAHRSGLVERRVNLMAVIALTLMEPANNGLPDCKLGCLNAARDTSNRDT